MTTLMMPLSYIRSNCSAQVEELKGQDTFLKKLSEMGINKGAKVSVVKNDSGSIVIKICESKLVISKGIAEKILVKIEEEQNE